MEILKVFHILFIFIWLGSLLTLTRLMAYLAKEEGAFQLKLGKICKRLYFLVDLPAMLMTIVLGLCVVFLKGVDLKAGWLHIKWTFAFLLVVCDILVGYQAAKLGKKEIQGKGTFFKVFHGMTALFLIGALVSIYVLKQMGI